MIKKMKINEEEEGGSKEEKIGERGTNKREYKEEEGMKKQ